MFRTLFMKAPFSRAGPWQIWPRPLSAVPLFFCVFVLFFASVSPWPQTQWWDMRFNIRTHPLQHHHDHAASDISKFRTVHDQNSTVKITLSVILTSNLNLTFQCAWTHSTLTSELTCGKTQTNPTKSNNIYTLKKTDFWRHSLTLKNLVKWNWVSVNIFYELL